MIMFHLSVLKTGISNVHIKKEAQWATSLTSVTLTNAIRLKTLIPFCGLTQHLEVMIFTYFNLHYSTKL
jgi:hypothetical protein